MTYPTLTKFFLVLFSKSTQLVKLKFQPFHRKGRLFTPDILQVGFLQEKEPYCPIAERPVTQIDFPSDFSRL